MVGVVGGEDDLLGLGGAEETVELRGVPAALGVLAPIGETAAVGAEDVLPLDQDGAVQDPHGEAVRVWGGRGGRRVGIFQLSNQLEYLFVVFGGSVAEEGRDGARCVACCHGYGKQDEKKKRSGTFSCDERGEGREVCVEGRERRGKGGVCGG